MMIVIRLYIHIETYRCYFKESAEEYRNGETKKKDIYNVTIYWKCKRGLYFK